MQTAHQQYVDIVTAIRRMQEAFEGLPMVLARGDVITQIADAFPWYPFELLRAAPLAGDKAYLFSPDLLSPPYRNKDRIVCQACKDQQHSGCIDIDQQTGGMVAGRLYRSCFCQHKVRGDAEAISQPRPTRVVDPGLAP